MFAASEGASVLVVEKEQQAGRKILISGGTRCNVLPSTTLDLQRDFFSESSTSALRALFSSWTLGECRGWLSDPPHHGGLGLVLQEEEETDKLFPASNSAADVRDALVAACMRGGVRFAYGSALADLQPLEGGGAGGWRCLTRDGRALTCRRAILSTGGRSFPKLGTTGDGWCVLEALGHPLQAPYPALTPLLLERHPGGAQLSGISLHEARVWVAPMGRGGSRGGGRGRQTSQRGDLLFTHRGMSGPAILDASHHLCRAVERGQQPPAIFVDWTGEGRAPWEQRLAPGGGGGAAMVGGIMRRCGISQRLAEALLAEAGAPADRKLAELRRDERQVLLEALSAWRLPVVGSEGYAKAEVTGGGLPLGELDLRTLESRRAPGLHVCGELLDVHGRIGGFNFLLAWFTGRAAGLAVAAALYEQGNAAAAAAAAV